MSFPASELGGGKEVVEVRIRPSETQLDLRGSGGLRERDHM